MMKNTDIIKYDRRDLNILKIACIVSVLIFLFGLGLIYLELDGTEVLCIASLYIGAGVGVVSAVRCFAAKMYLGRLEAFGYEVPYDKKDYGKMLCNLPKHEFVECEKHEMTEEPIVDSQKDDQKSMGSNRSQVLSKICLVIWLICIACNVVFLVSWSFYESAKAMVFMLAIGEAIWLILVLIFGLQSSPEKYKEDVEIDASRKNRYSIEASIFVILFFLGVTYVANNTGASMVKYIYLTSIEGDRGRLNDISYSMQEVFDTLSVNGYEEWNDTYQQLKEGVIINDWNDPKDIFQKETASRLFIDSFHELDDKIKISKGPAQIFCILDEKGQIHAYLKNPIIKATQEKLDGIMIPE